MTKMFRPWSVLATVATISVVAGGVRVAGQDSDSFRFKSGVELINVTATVTDKSGRFVSGLTQDDFIVYEENELQTVSHFSNERVPVSLGIVLDTSGSMMGEKLSSAQAAIDRFLTKLLDPVDEIFLYEFNSTPDLLQNWTTDRNRLSRVIGRLHAAGGTAMLDALVESVPLAMTGQHRKRAILLISDGNDTDSESSLSEVKQLIRESEVMVYAIGIDGSAETTLGPPQPPFPGTRRPLPVPIPIPGGRRPGGVGLPLRAEQFQFPFPSGQRPRVMMGGDRVNVGALRDITDDSGGRTEVIRSARDLDPATASIADELSRQYYLGYASTMKKDGRWHTIRVETKDKNYRVRARRGYIATP